MIVLDEMLATWEDEHAVSRTLDFVLGPATIFRVGTKEDKKIRFGAYMSTSSNPPHSPIHQIS